MGSGSSKTQSSTDNSSSDKDHDTGSSVQTQKAPVTTDISKKTANHSPSTVTRIMNESANAGSGNAAGPNTSEKLIDEGPQDQLKFDSALRSACLLVKADSVYKYITKNVTKLQLGRALPLHFNLPTLLSKFTNLKDLDLSSNRLGGQGFSAVCLAMCSNNSILSLNLAENMTDTDSADSVGRMLAENKTLQYLDVSSNYLGKDYFSRKVGPILKDNKSLRTLRCESLGTTDARMFVEGLQDNTNITDLDFSSNSLSDPLNFCKSLSDYLSKDECALCTLNLSRCELSSVAMREMERGLAQNKSLHELNLTGSQIESQEALLKFVVTAARHPCLHNISLDAVRCKSASISDVALSVDNVSKLQVLSLRDCGIEDAFFTALEKTCKGKLLQVTEVDIASNKGLTTACLDCVVKITSAEGQSSSLRNLRYGLNKGDNLASKLTEFPNLQYINLRSTTISQDELCKIGSKMNDGSLHLSTLILDGLKLSGTQVLKLLLGNGSSSSISTLSLGSCALDDKDLGPLCEAMKAGMHLTMLKLAANRITEVGVEKLVDAILQHKDCQLSVLDLSNNQFEDTGAKALSKLFTANSKLQSLNISVNNIGKEGLASLTGKVAGKSSPLRALHVNGQRTSLYEDDLTHIITQLANTLGYKIEMDGETVKAGCCDLPSNLPEGLLVKLNSLGGEAGHVGQAMDSPCIQTDYINDRLPSLTLQHVMDICCYLKGKKDTKDEGCVWSELEWDMITRGDKATTDTPSWLKLASSRDRCVYLSNLPGSSSIQKVEAVLEMDADCNVDETCLLKDPVTRSVSGVGWCMLSDQESVNKAIDYFNTGQAKIFGQAIMISVVKVKVDNEASSELEKMAMDDREKRSKLRAQEDAAHKTLLFNTTEASWKRQQYRLAHPAYADGRIW